MAQYTLARRAVSEVAALIAYLHREAGSAVADKVENRLFSAFDNLAEGRALGHIRRDLTSNVLFYFAKPYLIVFRRTAQRTFILRVLHASRDISALL